jgi:hypothetical protein
LGCGAAVGLRVASCGFTNFGHARSADEQRRKGAEGKDWQNFEF